MNNKGFTSIISILSVAIIIIIIIISLFIMYIFQINFEIYKVKKDLFYIVQNVYISLDENEIIYNNYEFDIDNMKSKIQILINKNLNNSNNVKIESLKYENSYIYIKLSISIKPIIDIFKETKITIDDKIKVKLLEVKNE